MKISTELAVSSQTQSDIEQHVDNENVISDSVSDNEGYYYLNQFLNIIGIFAMLYGFIFSLGLMGDSFKILGGRTAGVLFKDISNPISGVVIGILGTVLVQSSSTSTSVVVGMVGADIISVKLAIPIIMGANIGTSVTNTIVAMGHIQEKDQRERAFGGAVVHDFFNMMCVLLFLPIECICNFLYYWSDFLTDHMSGYKGGTFKSPLKYIVDPLIKLIISVDKKKIKQIANNEIKSSEVDTLIKGGFMKGMDDNLAGSLCLGVSLILLCIFLYGLVTFLKRTLLSAGEKSIRYSLQFSDTWWGGYLSILIGMLLTISVQSSSVTTSAITPLVGLGFVTIEQMYPITLGANIGTTCTGLLAALVTGKVNALQVALCHLSFNILGVLIFYPIEAVRNKPIEMAKFFGKIARSFKWFPCVYIVLVFMISPLSILGISVLFEINIIGTIAASAISLIILSLLIKLYYWYYYQDGETWLLIELDRGDEMN